ELQPCVLHFLADFAAADAFDGGDRLLADSRHWSDAGASGRAVDMNRAGAAEAHAAAEFAALQIKLVTKNPEERRIALDIHCARLAIHVDRVAHAMSSKAKRARCAQPLLLVAGGGARQLVRDVSEPRKSQYFQRYRATRVRPVHCLRARD